MKGREVSSRYRYVPTETDMAHLQGSVLAMVIVAVFSTLSAFRFFVASPDLVGFLIANPLIVVCYIFLIALSTLNWKGFEIVKWWGLLGVIAGGALPVILGMLGWIGYAELSLTELATTLPFYLLVGRGSRTRHETSAY